MRERETTRSITVGIYSREYNYVYRDMGGRLKTVGKLEYLGLSTSIFRSNELPQRVKTGNSDVR
jgi:hypothetical protein